MKNYKSIITILVSLLLIGILILSAIWLKKTIHHGSNFKPSASILEVMNSIVDPNADFVWNSVAVITTAAGTEEKAPHTDEEWAEVRRHAITLSEATNLLLIEGRKVAPDHIDTSSVPAELKAEEVQKLIDEHSEDFVRHAHELHDAVQLAIVAIDAKNPDELVKAGGKIDHVCEQCHKQFWYPNDKVPSAKQDIGFNIASAVDSSTYLRLRTSLN